ncbi:MAG: phosphoenolpyruvate--protein phosphotransferase, partial [Pyrinomonadaceae bacterium]|nr:phosphoenolpyruvate--protein phosphotransferase [Pyrinomonadaceae bacterium]
MEDKSMTEENMKRAESEGVTVSANRLLVGRAVSRGIGIGEIELLYGAKRQYSKAKIDTSEAVLELDRFRGAVSTAEGQLEELVGSDGAGEGQAGIFETHLLFLRDRSLLKKIEVLISEDKLNCEWAVSAAIEEFSSRYRKLSDKHLREKYIDLEDVGERLLASLGNTRNEDFRIKEGAVVAASQLRPSTMIEIAASRPAGLITEAGGWTSHSFILARELEIPAVTGIAKVMRYLQTGETVIVDGYRGEVLLNPTKEKLATYESSIPFGESQKSSPKAKPVVETQDGVSIRVYANLDPVSKKQDEEIAMEHGIGLYRSEYLFTRTSGYPSEKEQIEKYKSVISKAGDAEVRIRTFDVSVDQLPGNTANRENNPALGLRGIRLGIRDKSQLRAQIRALLIAGQGKTTGIVLPLVTDISEILYAKEMIEEVTEELAAEGIESGGPAFGVMIEVPSTIFQIDEIFEIVDFVNVGTNDLIQYLLAADRDNDLVAGLFRSLHPAVSK